MMKPLAVVETPINGMYKVQLEVHGDERGWFKESYQKDKMEALGLPNFSCVQNNFSFNAELGVTRGLHAEPWEKFISLANGKVFGAWVDLRTGDSFGKTFFHEINPSLAFFVPRGVANGYQTLEANITYTYLVNSHWSQEAKYSSVNLFDPDLAINWPIPKQQATISEKDLSNPTLRNLKPVDL